jgi:hypothetical protein
MLKTFLKTTLFIIIFFTFINKANAQFKILEDLKKAGDQLQKGLEIPDKKSKTPDSSSSEPIKTDHNESKSNASSGEFINLPNSKYLTVEAFQKNFNGKIVFLKSLNSGSDLVFKINSSKLANSSNIKEAEINTDIYYTKNNQWVKEKLKVTYYEDGVFCDIFAKQNCIKGAMAMYINAFEYPFAIIKTQQKNIGNTVTSPEGFKLVPVNEVQNGDVSYKANEWRLRSGTQNDPHFAVTQLTEDQKIIAELEKKINSSKLVNEEKQKKDKEAISKQVAFNKSYRLACTFSADGKVTQATFGADGKKFIMNTINMDLGVEMKNDTGSVIATREGSTSVVKFVNNVQALGLIQTITIDFEKGRADQLVMPLNRTYIGICNKL